MKSETYLSAKITDEGRVEVAINGTTVELLVLLEREAVSIFEECEKHGHQDSLALLYLFVKNVAKEVLDIDL